MPRKKPNPHVSQLSLPWVEIPADWTLKDIGAPLLASLAEGLYDDREVLREYIQNAIDAYVDFRKFTGLDPLNTVQIFIEPETAEVGIMDRGVGMDRTDISRAKSIAVSPKLARPNEFVGFRGIGIWSGLSACDQLVLETTKVKVPFLYRLTIDFRSIREHIHDPISIDELLQGRFEILQQETNEQDHYTHVRLVNIKKDHYPALLNIAEITKYISQYLPVPFDPNWPYTASLKEALETVPWTATYDITINGEPVSRIFPPDAEIKKPEFESIVDDEGRQVAYAWYAETKRTGQRKAIEVNYEHGEVNNFAVRVKNFVVGNRGLYATQQDVPDVDNLDWYVGEIYITDLDIKPDTNRRSFQGSFRYKDVVKALQRFYTKIATSARGWSEEVNILATCNSVNDSINGIESILLQRESILDEQKDSPDTLQKVTQLRQLLSEQKNKLGEALNKANAPDGSSPRVQAVQRYLRKVHVKNAIDTALNRIENTEEKLEEILSNVPIQPSSSIEISSNGIEMTGNGRRKTSKKNILRSKEKPITTTDALKIQIVAGDSLSSFTSQEGEIEGIKQDEIHQLVTKQSVSLELAISTFFATVAAIVGEGSEIYKRIEERLPDELRRRGIDV